MISLMHIGWGDYLSRACRDFWRLLIRAAPFSIFGDIEMKRTLKQSQEELKEFMAFIRRLPSYVNENTWQISVQRCSQWGVYVRIYPSGYYPWWDERDMNYFQSWAQCHEWNVIIRCHEGVPVAEFRTRL